MTSAPARFKELCLDALDHQAMADWWCAALGYVRKDTADDGTPRRPEEPVPIVDPYGSGPLIWLNPVPERKTVKNRMHLDVVDRKSTRLNSSHANISYAVFCLKKKNHQSPCSIHSRILSV